MRRHVGLARTATRSNLLTGLLTAALMLGYALPTAAREPANRHQAAALSTLPPEAPVTPSRQPRSQGAAARQHQLSEADADAERYRRVFDLQDAGDWDGADAVIQTITDDRLMGHVLYQRLVNDTRYKASPAELQDWLERFGDHPNADRVYRLALRRTPPGQARPSRPRAEAQTAIDVAPRGREARNRQAEALLSDDRGVDVPAPIEPGTRRSGNPHWTAGLAAWRSNQIDRAARHFETLAESDTASAWDRSAGAYWAARAHQRAHRPAERNRWLAEAARHPLTFYGLIAQRTLGDDAGTRPRLPPFTSLHSREVAVIPAGRRALALLQVGRRDLAEQELTRIDPRGNRLLQQAVLVLSDEAGMAAQTLKLANEVRPAGGGYYDAALFPMPRWNPSEGFTIDPALVFALTRQESKFQPDARSPAGARGLMQLMPETARFMAVDDERTNGRNLTDPELNLSLGQRYVRYLMEQKDIGDDLILMLAAYNAGPGNLQKWRRQFDRIKDPLLFLESLPSRETRTFVEQVLTNYWMYRRRLDQPEPSLDAIAAGKWPVYMPVEIPVTQVADDGKN